MDGYLGYGWIPGRRARKLTGVRLDLAGVAKIIPKDEWNFGRTDS